MCTAIALQLALEGRGENYMPEVPNEVSKKQSSFGFEEDYVNTKDEYAN